MLAGLPEIQFCETAVDSIESAVITTYEAITGRTLAQGDPVRLFLQSIAMIIVQQRVLIDSSAKQNLLAYSKENYLDHIGAMVGVERLNASAAQTTLRFTLSVAQPQVVTIPTGIRVTTENNIVFATTSAVDIPVGNISVEVPAVCLIQGTRGNGYVAGQINKFVDPLPWVQSVSNTNTSAGGADVEGDDSLRERIHQAPESFSVAGPDGAYEFWAKTTSQLIVDVAVYSPSPGVVEIRPLLAGGDLPSAEILTKVNAICNDRKIRPLTDRVTVLAPEIVNYDIAARYYIDRANATTSMAIQMAVNKAAADFVTWQKSKIGRDINPTEFVYRLRAAGASRVEVDAPTFASVARHQVAVAKNILVTFGGLADG